MSAKAIEVSEAIDLKGLSFGEAADALRDVKKAKGYVSKKPDGAASGRWAFCFSFLPDEYNEGELLDLIGAEYGPGEYPVQFKTPNEGGREQIRWQQNYVVQQRRLGAQIQQQVPPPAAPTDALAAALTSIADTQTRILEALNRRPDPQPQKTTIEIAQELAALKDLFSDGKQSVVEQVKDVLELKQMLLDNNDTPADPLAAALKYLGPAIEKGMEGANAMQYTRPEAQVKPDAEAAPAQPEGAAPADPLPAELQIDRAFEFFAAQFMPAALQLAESAQDPAGTAEYLARLIGNNQVVLGHIGLVLSQDNMVQRFAGFEPRVMQYAAWFDEVGDRLAYALWPEANKHLEPRGATDDATTENGDGGNDTIAGEPQGEPDDGGIIAGGDNASDIDASGAGDDNDP